VRRIIAPKRRLAMTSRVPLTILTALFSLTCLASPSTAAKQIKPPPLEGGAPCVRATASFPQFGSVGAEGDTIWWSTPCGGDFSSVSESDDQWQCVQEVATSSGTILEHFWVFRNVPPGYQYLSFEGHVSPGSNDDFLFAYNESGRGPLNQPISNPLDASTFIPKTAQTDVSNNVFFIQTTAPATTFYILLRSNFNQPGQDASADKVYIDRLVICTQP